ncbi:tetratricopeptide repeat protein [Dokdonia genika]|uniref:Tetratricopeptide repeat protein n=1 Tax=Dokdonia genika TaxID=308113 RepID=A0ABV9L8I2_9FLAO
MFNVRLTILTLFLSPTVYLLGQNPNVIIPDSLKTRSFELLMSNFWDEYENTLTAETIAAAYNQKARGSNNKLELVRSFDLLARLYTEETNITYADSILLYSADLESSSYPSVGYSLKGYNYYSLGDYEKALDNYLKAYDSAKEKGNEYQLIEITQVIGALKNRWGNYEEALEIYKEHYGLLKSLDKAGTDYREDYLITLYNLSLSYQRNKKFDSSSIYIQKGIEESLEGRDSLFLIDFRHAEAVNLYLTSDFVAAQDAFLNLTSNANDTFKESITNYYLGQMAFKANNATLGIEYYQKVDSVFKINNEEYPELRNVYESLVTYFRQKSMPAKELDYIRQLLKVDSSLARNREYLNQTIIKKYETPELIEDQKNLIEELNGKNKRTSRMTYAFGASLIILFIPLVYFYRRSIVNARRFKELQSKREQHSEEISSHKNLITDEIEILIIQKLEKFEANLGFTDEDLSLNRLAKEIGSNSTYVSRVINDTKGKNFSNYINDLRIEHILKRLDEETILINYKIQSLGEEVGFKNSEAFSKAFFKYTQIKPSFYLKKLREQQNIRNT